MEDAHSTVLELQPESDDLCGFFGVYDGHGGDRVAKFAGDHLPRILAGQPALTEGDYGKALQQTFLDADEELRKLPVMKDDPSGCTAVTLLVTKDKIVCGNAGDSRCILGVKGKAVALSHDHKPSNPSNCFLLDD